MKLFKSEKEFLYTIVKREVVRFLLIFILSELVILGCVVYYSLMNGSLLGATVAQEVSILNYIFVIAMCAIPSCFIAMLNWRLGNVVTVKNLQKVLKLKENEPLSLVFEKKLYASFAERYIAFSDKHESYVFLLGKMIEDRKTDKYNSHENNRQVKLEAIKKAQEYIIK